MPLVHILGLVIAALAVVAIFFPPDAEAGKRPPILPWFVIGVFVLAMVNSTGIIPKPVASSTEQLAGGCLACAVAATGIRSPMATLMKTGGKPLIVIGAASLTALAKPYGRMEIMKALKNPLMIHARQWRFTSSGSTCALSQKSQILRIG